VVAKAATWPGAPGSRLEPARVKKTAKGNPLAVGGQTSRLLLGTANRAMRAIGLGVGATLHAAGRGGFFGFAAFGAGAAGTERRGTDHQSEEFDEFHLD